MKKNSRRHDIDWIRILAFDMLIFFHIGMFFNAWDSELKNNITINWLTYPMYFSSLWRLPLLFVVSGMGTRFALSYRSGSQYIKERFIRLFIPLLIGILIIVPPQVYVERVADGDFSGSFWAFYPHFFEPVYPKGNLSWHHLWFLSYLLFMSIIATPLFLKLRRDTNIFSQRLQGLIARSPYFLYLFVIPLYVVEAGMKPHFPITRAFFGDWYALVYYFIFFIAGFVLITIGQSFWKAIDKIKLFALLTGLLGYQVFWWLSSTFENHVLIPVVNVILSWSIILAIFGYGAKFLNKPGRILKYRNEAVYPFYIIHYTIILLLGFWLMNKPMTVTLKFVIMLVGTFGGSWMFFEIVKRIRILRPLFGLKAHKKGIKHPAVAKRLMVLILFLGLGNQLPGQAKHFVSSTKELNDSTFAEWVSMPGINGNEYGVYYFRKDFTLKKKPGKFLVHVSADNRYRLYVNGKRVCWGPAAGDLQEWNYETIDIANELLEGVNLIAAQVWNYGSSMPARQISSRTAFILQGNTSAEQILNTNSSWRVLRDAGYHPLNQSSACVGGGYIAGPTDSLNAAFHPWGWNDRQFDDRTWVQAEVLGKGNHLGLNTWLGTPWLLRQRSIPEMQQEPEETPAILRVEGLKLPTGSAIQDFKFTVPKHTRVKLLLDNKVLTMGYPGITVSNGKKAEIRIRYQEALFDRLGQKGDRNDWQHKSMKGYYDVFLCDGGMKRVFEPLWIRVFRYVEIEIETRDEAIEVLGFNNLFTAYPFEQKGNFICNNAAIDSIWNVAWRTVRLCALETYMDCPYYEQLQYIGDTRIQALISMYVAGDDRLVKNAIRQFYNSMQPMGLTKSNHPSHGVQIIPPFSLLYISMIHDYFMLGSDTEFVKGFIPGIRFILDWFISRIDDRGMTGPLPYWNHIDGGTKEFKAGSPPGIEEGHSAHMSILLAYALKHAADMLEYFDAHNEAKHYRSIASGLISSTLKHCYDPDKGLIAETPQKQLFSQHTNSMAILTNAFSKEQESAVARIMLTDEDLAQATLYFNFYVFQALKKAGLGGETLKQMNLWQEFLNSGFTTFPEHGVNSRSDCHAWSSHPIYNLLNITCGISSLEPGFKSVLIEPQPGDLEFVEGTVTHPSGMLLVKYKKESNGKLKCEVDLPPQTSGVFRWKKNTVTLTSGSNIFVVE